MPQSTLKTTAITVPIVRVDWRQISEDLKANGVSFNLQCRLLGCPWSTYLRWRSGSQPLYAHGYAFISLHQAVCGSELTQKRLVSVLESD